MLNVQDQRVFTPYGRVADPEDILGVVRVHQGKLVPNSYEKMPTHRLLSMNGVFQLTDFLSQQLLRELENKK